MSDFWLYILSACVCATCFALSVLSARVAFECSAPGWCGFFSWVSACMVTNGLIAFKVMASI